MQLVKKKLPAVVGVLTSLVVLMGTIYLVVRVALAERQLSDLQGQVSALWSNTGDWYTSSDGKVLARFNAERERYQPGEPVSITWEVTNVSDGPLEMEVPGYGPWDLRLERNGVKAKYEGGVPQPAAPTSVTLLRHQREKVTITLDPKSFPDLNSPGAFVVTSGYRSGSEKRDWWQGYVGPLKARWISQ